jgi:hypothetical protein
MKTRGFNFQCAITDGNCSSGNFGKKLSKLQSGYFPFIAGYHPSLTIVMKEAL